MAIVFVEIVIELIVNRTGQWVLRLLGRKSAPDDNAAVIVGLVVWAGIAAACVIVYFATIGG